ncbi:MAG: glycosyltransferase family 2 protein [Candidatus Caenarcaniphilales bacterium]|jgi:1,2-diacylglycerol 3-beta-glucosyltransferase|nr:glycosyltransferase family 2 protein [Candidatus Caenarcaniphilales bacterium]
MSLLKNKFNTRKLKIFSFWQGNNKDRIMLFGIIFGVWILIKAIEEFVPSKYLEKLPSDVSLTLVALIVVVMGIHAIYIFIAQNHRRKESQVLSYDYQPSIDIFISAHNEENVIGGTLNYLLSLSYPKLKIYAINDRSKDQTINIMNEIASKSTGKLIIIDRASDAFPGKSAALNDALKASSGEVICVLDADARIEDQFLFNIVRYLEDDKVAAVQSQKVISNPEFNFLTRCQYHEYAMDSYMQMGRDSIRGAVELRGNGMLVKRVSLEDVGGWNEETLTDDLDLSTCLHVAGWDIRFSPEDKVYEEGVPTIDGFIKQRRRWAEGSMRRYLNYSFQLMKPGNLSIVQIFDTFVFLSEFSIPLWLGCDMVYEMIRLSSGRETYFSFLMFITLGLGVVLFVAQFNGLRIYHKQKFFQAFINALIGISYLLSIWTTVIILTYRKILFSRTVGTWTRTEHGKAT